MSQDTLRMLPGIHHIQGPGPRHREDWAQPEAPDRLGLSSSGRHRMTQLPQQTKQLEGKARRRARACDSGHLHQAHQENRPLTGIGGSGCTRRMEPVRCVSSPR